MSISRAMESGYVLLAHGLGQGAEAVGLTPWLDWHAPLKQLLRWNTCPTGMPALTFCRPHMTCKAVDLRLLVPDAPPSTAPLYRSQKPGKVGSTFSADAVAIEDAQVPFDLIMVDGRTRQACLAHACKRLAPGGMIGFDNSNRARYQDAIAQRELDAARLRGLTPSLPYPDEATLLTVKPGSA